MKFTIDILKVAEILTACAVIGSAVFALVRWLIKQNKQDEDIRDIKEENTIICYALKACLDGLEQLGANHTVPRAKNDLEKYLNKKAHEQTGKDKRK